MTPKPRIPLLAAALSIFMPGLGQLYCGKVARALAVATIGSIILFALGYAIRNGSLSTIMLTQTVLGTVFSIAVTIDAWLLAKKAPADYVPDEQNRPAAYGWYTALVLTSSVLIAVILAGLIKQQLRTYRVAGASMNPTLIEGDTVFADHEPYLANDPELGDLVVYQSPKNRKQQWLSRVIAKSGQTVEIRDHKLVIDGKPLPFSEDGDERMERIGDFSYRVIGMKSVKDTAPVTVPEHHVFLMSDNRSNSVDSRIFGPVGITSIDGRLSHRYFPRSRAGAIDQP